MRSMLILLLVVTTTGCDPEYRHQFTGRVVSSTEGEPLEDARISFTLYPIEDFNHWRSDLAVLDSTFRTDTNGQFEIGFSTLFMIFDSIEIGVYKEGFEERITNSTSTGWTLRRRGVLREFKYDFGEIALQSQ